MQPRLITILLTTSFIVGCNVGYDPDSVPLECEGPSCEDGMDLTQDAVEEVDGSDTDTNDVSPEVTDTGDASDVSDQSDGTQDLTETTDVSDMGVECGPTMCAPGEVCCMNETPTCVDIDVSLQNCGTCGNACPVGAVCEQGECRCDNPSGEICTTRGDRCDGLACVCGQAMRVCNAGETCENNQCRMP